MYSIIGDNLWWSLVMTVEEAALREISIQSPKIHQSQSIIMAFAKLAMFGFNRDNNRFLFQEMLCKTSAHRQEVLNMLLREGFSQTQTIPTSRNSDVYVFKRYGDKVREFALDAKWVPWIHSYIIEGEWEGDEFMMIISVDTTFSAPQLLVSSLSGTYVLYHVTSIPLRDRFTVTYRLPLKADLKYFACVFNGIVGNLCYEVFRQNAVSQQRSEEADIAYKFKNKNWDSQRDGVAYLHEFDVAEPIEYIYVRDEGGTPPEMDARCGSVPCVHPQTILHDGNWLLLQELGTELTMHRRSEQMKRIRHIKTYHVDVPKLIAHSIHTALQWPPTKCLSQAF